MGRVRFMGRSMFLGSNVVPGSTKDVGLDKITTVAHPMMNFIFPLRAVSTRMGTN